MLFSATIPRCLKKVRVCRITAIFRAAAEEDFSQRYDEEFGENVSLSPRNIVNTKQIEVKTPDVTVHVNGERSDLVETRIIDGKRYLLICVEDGVEVDGVNIHIS